MDSAPPPIRAETLEMIERLVGFDTTSRASNLGLIEWVRDWLRGHGVDSTLYYDQARNKANLFATVGGGPRPGIVLSGHTDVVPVDGQDWHTDPFVATPRGDRIYGRGTADMKSFLAVALAMTPRFVAARLSAPVHFALSYDEEVGCLGVRSMLEGLQRRGLEASGCVVGEPTSMQVVIAHKGQRRYRCIVHGKEAHSALTPHGVNAIEYAARLVVHARHMADRFAATEPRHYGFDVPFTTMQTGTIRGGTAFNIVARECRFDLEFRYLPAADPDAIEREIRDYAEKVLVPEMRRVDPAVGIEIETLARVPGLDMDESDQLVRLGEALAQRPGTTRVAYATEAGLFQQAGIASIICGPGSIGDAHKPNESIALEQIVQCEAFMERLVAELGRA
jgi:acetylornithine deacetylase